MPEQTETSTVNTIKIAKVIDEYTLVINQGSQEGVSVGERFLVYSIGEEIFDPDSKKSLGRLEIVRGTGKVQHLQKHIATIASDMKDEPSRIIRKNPGLSSIYSLTASVFGSTQEIETLPADRKAFENPEVGDLVKRI